MANKREERIERMAKDFFKLLDMDDPMKGEANAVMVCASLNAGGGIFAIGGDTTGIVGLIAGAIVKLQEQGEAYSGGKLTLDDTLNGINIAARSMWAMRRGEGMTAGGEEVPLDKFAQEAREMMEEMARKHKQ